MSVFFFVNDTATTTIYTLSLHDALPIFLAARTNREKRLAVAPTENLRFLRFAVFSRNRFRHRNLRKDFFMRRRSEEHTSELQSRENLVCRLLLEKKKNKKQQSQNRYGSH